MENTNGRDLLFIPEIAGLDARSSIVRIPPELDVPLTPRVRKLIDSRAFRRLANTSQLGFVRFVYPGATHTRFEHSLGVYRLTLLILKRLAHDQRFANLVTVKEAETLILAALLHDIGHFPYCHLIEDLKVQGGVSHEQLAAFFLSGELSVLLKEDWGVDPNEIIAILTKRAPKQNSFGSDEEFVRRIKVFRLLSSVLSGPIDVDKMDYLTRDSLAAGVPYGKNYDVDRLVGSICLNRSGDGIAISSKGKTAAELMVFARYVMFSEVYWHHTARAATVMFQRLIDCITDEYKIEKLLLDLQGLSDAKAQLYLTERCNTLCNKRREEARRLCSGLFGEQRLLYKRIRQFSAMEEPKLYKRLAGSPYHVLREISYRLAQKLNLQKTDILIDAPPVDKEVEFKIDVYYSDDDQYRPLSEVSPVVRALAQEQFDDYVKRVRVFVAPNIASKYKNSKSIDTHLEQAIEEIESRR